MINLEYSVAITQNYVSAANFGKVARWLKERPGQVSGCRDEEHARDVRERFVGAVLAARPELKCDLDSEPGRSGAKRKRAENGNGMYHPEEQEDDSDGPAPVVMRGLWDSLRSSSAKSGENEASAAKPFSFGFA